MSTETWTLCYSLLIVNPYSLFLTHRKSLLVVRDDDEYGNVDTLLFLTHRKSLLVVRDDDEYGNVDALLFLTHRKRGHIVIPYSS